MIYLCAKLNHDRSTNNASTVGGSRCPPPLPQPKHFKRSPVRLGLSSFLLIVFIISPPAESDKVFVTRKEFMLILIVKCNVMPVSAVWPVLGHHCMIKSSTKKKHRLHANPS